MTNELIVVVGVLCILPVITFLEILMAWDESIRILHGVKE
jgi:hypothetical protein